MLKKWINSFAWWLYSSTRKDAEPLSANEIHLKVSVDATQALEEIKKIKEEIIIVHEMRGA